MALKNELNKKFGKKSKVIVFCIFPILLICSIVGVVINYFNFEKNKIADSNEKEYEYEYEYDENWQEILKYTEEQREKYENIDCECG